MNLDKELTKGNTGAVNALKGYRVQALYSICRVLENGSPDLIYIPEGIEDLDIRDKQSALLELHQVKNVSNPLTLSGLFSKTGTSFFRRAIEAHEKGHNAQLRVICFGEIGTELKVLFSEKTSQESFNERLRDYESRIEQLQFIKENTAFISLNEDEIQEQVIELVKEKAIAIDPKIAIDYLHFWLFYLSEKGGEITHETLLSKLNDIGKFVDERQNFHKHLHTSIRSIHTQELSQNQLSILSKSFYEGVGANYQHIQAGLDVVREDKISEIFELFKQSNTVIIHGASGQGKSSLAYRYVWQYHSILAYEISTLPSLQSTLEQMQALRAFSSSLEIPVLLYIDVQPGNQNWTRILSEFAFNTFFRFLVTIRQEDWNRTHDKGAEFPFKDIELSLDKEEAKHIYEDLDKKITDLNFTDFEEAWVSFGGKGPLLEFTHLITQGKTLKARIESQLNRIEDQSPEFITVLKIIGLADHYGTRVSLKKLNKANIVSKLRLGITILEKEFLLKLSDDEKWLTGLHPIRSKIIDKILHLDDEDRKNTILECLELIDEDSLFIFLINSFINVADYRLEVINKLGEVTWSSFTALKEITNALIWFGIKSFVESNYELLQQWHQKDNFLMGVRAYFNFTNTFDIDNLYALSPNYKNIIKEVSEKLSELEIDKAQLLKPLKKWLEHVQLPKSRTLDNLELPAYGEFLYWVGNHGVGKVIEFNEEVLKVAIEEATVEDASVVLFGLHSYGVLASEIALKYEDLFLTKLQLEYDITLFERSDREIKAYYLIDLYKNESEIEENIIHTLKLKVLDALRYGLPYLQKHGCEGYGHKLHVLPTDWDESKANIEITNQPVRYLVKANAILFNLFFFQQRPTDWVEFTAEVLALRKKLVQHFQDFAKAFEEYYRKRRNSHLVRDWAINNLTNLDFKYQVSFPQTISDSMGLVSEGDDKNPNNPAIHNEEVSILISKFEDYRKAHYKLFGALHTFNWQSIKVVLDHYNLSEEKQLGLKRSSLVNIIDAFSHLRQYQKAFRSHFEKYTNSFELNTIEKQENELIPNLLYCWKHFVTPSQLYKKAARKESLRIFEKLKIDFEKKLKKNCDALTVIENHSIELKAHFNIIPNVVLLTVDLIEVLDMEKGLEYAISAIKDAVGSCKTLSFKHTMLEVQYPEFCILPTILYEVFQFNAYKYKLYHFIEELNDHKSLIVPQFRKVDSSIIEQLELRMFDDKVGKIRIAETFLTNYQKLTLDVGIACQIRKIAELDGHTEEGVEVLKNQIHSANHRLSKSFINYVRIFSEQLQFFSEHSDFNQVSDIEREYFEFLLEFKERTWPTQSNDGKEDFEISLNPKEIEDWQQRLEKQGQNAFLIYLYLIHIATTHIA